MEFVVTVFHCIHYLTYHNITKFSLHPIPSLILKELNMLNISELSNRLRITVHVVNFARGKLHKKCYQDLTYGGNFHDNLPISFAKRNLRLHE